MPGVGPVCCAPRPAVPGLGRFTGVLGSRFRKRRRWLLPEGRGRPGSPPGKSRRGHVSAPCRFTAMDGMHVTGTEWLVGVGWGGCHAAARETDLRPLASLGTPVWF